MASNSQVLFIGNSFTGRNALPRMLAELAASAKPPRHMQTDQVLANGMALKTHWERGTALESIRGKRWDFVVLQEQSTLPLKNRQRMHEYIKHFAQEIRTNRSRPVLYMTWARQSAWERQDELADAYLSIGRELNMLVAPVGSAWQTVLKQHPRIVLHDKDGSHPNPARSYLAACVFYATLFGATPVGMKMEPAMIARYGQKTMETLQEVALSTVSKAGAD